MKAPEALSTGLVWFQRGLFEAFSTGGRGLALRGERRLSLAGDEDLADARKALGVAHALEHLSRALVEGRGVAEEGGVDRDDQVAPVLGGALVLVRAAHERAGEQLDHHGEVARLVPAVEGAQRAWSGSGLGLGLGLG